MNGKQIVFVCAAICLTLAALVSARSAAADLLWQTGQLSALLRLIPDHSAARILRAEPGDLEHASASSPAISQPLIDLALQAESQGDLAKARRHLDEALRRDATFRPQWAMINFLTRHGETEDVLKRAQPAAAIYEGDLTALFDLCLRSGASPDRIYKVIVPPRPKAQREYLELLVRRGMLAEALAPALRLADIARPTDRQLLFDYCDQLLAAGAGVPVLRLWRTLPRFGAAPGRCLDWQRPHVDGVSLVEVSETVVRLELSGRQPESATVLRRPAVLEPGRSYHLRALVSGEDASRNAVEWRWNGAVAGSGDQSDIEVGATKAVSELELVIRRRPGQRSAEGPLEITNIRLEPKAAALAGKG